MRDFRVKAGSSMAVYHTEIVGTCLQIDIRFQTIHLVKIISYHAIRCLNRKR